MMNLHCQQCRKTLLKTVAFEYSHANDSIDGQQQIKCNRCGRMNWFTDRRLVDLVASSENQAIRGL